MYSNHFLLYLIVNNDGENYFKHLFKCGVVHLQSVLTFRSGLIVGLHHCVSFIAAL